MERRIFPDPASAAEACGREILLQLGTVPGGEDASLAISGGTTPALMFRYLAQQRFEWSRVHLFWVDERAVPPTDAQSNYKLADETFITPAAFPRANVHRVKAELPPEEAAAWYADDVRQFFERRGPAMPRFDVIHRGMGPDAHTASLFPGEPLIGNRDGLAAAVWVAKMSQWRITLLPGVLVNAACTVVLAAGADKAAAVRDIFGQPYDPKKYPSQLGMEDERPVTWFLDEAAAALVK